MLFMNIHMVYTRKVVDTQATLRESSISSTVNFKLTKCLFHFNLTIFNIIFTVAALR